MWSQPGARRAIVVAGCLGMVYTQLTMSPATIQYARSLGATGFHIGLLGAMPASMLFMQFVAAITANYLQHRRGIWVAVSVLQRLAIVPLALGPLWLSGVNQWWWLWGLILATALNHALLHFCTPLWLSWMGDYLPREGLSRYWGVRHLWMQWAGAASLFAGALFIHQSGLDIRISFAGLILAGAVFGIADVLCFLNVEEPPVTRVLNPQLGKVLSAPFRERGFRSFVAYTCFWHFAAMVGAPFISLYLLAHLKMGLFHVLMLWTLSWVGGAVMSRRLGWVAETFGSRPVLVLCTALKSSNMIALILVPAQVVVAFWILVPVFMLDALLNAGIAIASNGFLLKHSPAENRTMYIAAGTAMAGMVGGVTSVTAGFILSATVSWELTLGSLVFNHFQLLFAASMILRWMTSVFALRIHEPESRATHEVVTLLVGATPLRLVRFPVGLYRTLRNGDQPTESVKSKKAA